MRCAASLHQHACACGCMHVCVYVCACACVRTCVALRCMMHFNGSHRCFLGDAFYKSTACVCFCVTAYGTPPQEQASGAVTPR